MEAGMTITKEERERIRAEWPVRAGIGADINALLDALDEAQAEIHALSITHRNDEAALAAAEARAEAAECSRDMFDAAHQAERTARENAERERDASRHYSDVLGRACATLRVKVERYLAASQGEASTEASWDAWEDMRIALGAFTTNDEVRDWEADLFAAQSELDVLRHDHSAVNQQVINLRNTRQEDTAQVSVLRERAEKAEAACAAMRLEIEEAARRYDEQSGEGNQCAHATRARLHVWDATDAGKALLEERDRLRAAIEWALGERDTFTMRVSGLGAFWWRAELRRRAALSTEPAQTTPTVDPTRET